MNAISALQTVAEVVRDNPGRSRIFDDAGIDYCCCGSLTVEQACREKAIDPAVVLARLVACEVDEHELAVAVDAAAMSLAGLADHIVNTHHAYLRRELPRLDALTEKVAAAHGANDARLHQVRDVFLTMANELYSHMLKEEQILFPMVKRLEFSDALPEFHCGSIANPIGRMEWEHDLAESALERLRELTDQFAPPEWACNTYRVLLDALAFLERDMRLHIDKENNVLFPRALELESQGTLGVSL
jgi:regulator of cell morphogenesis and NO signaling